MWCDLGFFPNSRGNKAAANLRPIRGLKSRNNFATYSVLWFAARLNISDYQDDLIRSHDSQFHVQNIMFRCYPLALLLIAVLGDFQNHPHTLPYSLQYSRSSIPRCPARLQAPVGLPNLRLSGGGITIGKLISQGKMANVTELPVPRTPPFAAIESLDRLASP